EVNYNLNYINVPLMLQFNKSGFFAEAGPQVGFLVTGKVKTTDGTNTEEMDVKDELNAIDFGVNLGAGYITNSGFGFGARY
ncbi:PorT family protein, partial [Lactococcus petauri]|uniref:PorT family protein n=1 Tax=Lactococcus petauri TaxID=1940789 RepID=UPI0021F10E78